jgi:hypothetical protein
MDITLHRVGGMPHPAAIRHEVEQHLGWICQMTGVEADDLIMLEVKLDLSRAFFNLLMQNESDCMNLQVQRSGLSRDVIRSFSIHPGTIPSIRLYYTPGLMYAQNADQGTWRSVWQDSPVAIHLEGLAHPVVVLRIPYSTTDNFQGWLEIAVVAKQDGPAYMELMETASSVERGSFINYHGSGPAPRRDGSWDEVVLGREGETLLRQDFETFWDRREWFQRQRLPYRRGYLLHGPPGNGKTSAVRAMLSRKGISAHSVHLHLPNVDDSDLLNMFEAAGNEAPSLVVLEDIDRCFAPSAEMDDGPQVHLQTLLNCLDGVSTCDGVVVVATANHPEVLDTAVLRRPGRFDRVVEFPNPIADLRQKYFAGRMCAMATDEMQACVDKTAGFSFAQLQEAYILAGQFAYDEDRDVGGYDLIHAAEMLKNSMHRADWKRTERRGFKPEEIVV